MTQENTINRILHNIRKTREQKSYTQEYLASQLGIDTKSYSNIENGVSKLSVERLIKIADILEATPESFLNPSQNFSFTHCANSGYLNNPKFNDEGFKEAKEAWIILIDELRSEIKFLREQVQKR
ncbi:MAG TPA: helix-turn-helix transcriptional regulator [Chitinophagales bacterium]|jgi:transcriptional regulator with XRE-family HTH domain|nr:helix-turn-helix transcriptional regulator [Chitinophagales bacterium]